jgi:AMP deaminase
LFVFDGFVIQAGAVGSVNHLAVAFMLADSIVHGLNLQRAPPLQYCFYLTQIGVSMAPLAENSLIVKLRDSPFFEYFKQGLVVALR